MEIYCFVLCCALFTTVATFTLPDSNLEHSKNDSLLQAADSQVCECVNGKCVTNRGKTKCVCKPRHALQEEFNCQPCYCGSRGTCRFKQVPESIGGFKYEKECICNPGSAEKDGTCVDCNCGVNSLCEFEGEEKVCFCMENYAEKDGICTECNCGFYGECKFEEGDKICKCYEGYLEVDGECRECDCGVNAIDCEFIDGVKKCDCKEKYSEDDGICEECDCGENSLECGFDDGEKKCKCSDGYVQKGDTCEEGCTDYRPCQNGGHCEGGFCKCLSGTSGEFCEVIEECESLCPKQRNISCVYDVAQQKPFCECLDDKLRYDPEVETCRNSCDETERCENGGTCTDSGFAKFCRCLKGTVGDFCERIPDCLTKDCGNDAYCGYDVKMERAHCLCKDTELSYDAQEKRCKRTCEGDATCKNHAKCEGNSDLKFCRCLDGTDGHFCENILGCEDAECGSEAECVYDVDKKSATCSCKDKTLKFDKANKKCKKSCDSDDDCHNGGSCIFKPYGKFCECLPGTDGDLCETVKECVEDSTKCKGESYCVFDVQKQKAVCECKEDGKRYDIVNGECRLTCYEDATCHNGGMCMHRGEYLFCNCKGGTSGMFCETVDDCEKGICGDMDDVKCLYDEITEGGICACKNPAHIFDPESKSCKGACDSDSQCKNGGKCVDKSCVCLEGTTGDLCEIIPTCSKMDCGDDAKCEYNQERRSGICVCANPKYSFDEADRKCKMPCDEADQCKNGGVCTQSGIAKFCRCLKGSEGEFCEHIPECSSKDCGTEAVCEYDVKMERAACICKDADFIFDEQEKRCKRACDSDSQCNNGGKCVDKLCACLEGTTGDLCEIIPACSKMDCGDDAKCEYSQEKRSAVCACANPKYSFDEADRKCKMPCDEAEQCKNGGVCTQSGIAKFCRCLKGSEGEFCEHIPECSSKDCGTEAVCKYDVKMERAACVCKDTDFTFDEQDKRCKKKRCIQKACSHGVCEVIDNEEVCTCFEGYVLEGDYCKKLNCSETPCINGTCVVRHGNREECVCQAGYTLKKDTCIRGACKQTTCYGGLCEMVDGELMCVCPPKFHLEGIGCYETVCKIHRCFGGKCVVNDNKEEICTCKEGYVLKNDVCKKILCKKNCFGGQCKMADGKEECICPAGFTVIEDVCREDIIRRRKE